MGARWLFPLGSVVFVPLVNCEGNFVYRPCFMESPDVHLLCHPILPPYLPELPLY